MGNLSVVLCCYNHGQYISRQLDAVCKQSSYLRELILVDDGSTDNSYEIMNSYRAKYSFIKLYRNPSNLGLFASVNFAANLVGGEYVSFLAADDIIDESLFREALEAFKKWPKAAWSCADIEEVNILTGVKISKKLDLSLSTKYFEPEEMISICKNKKFNFAFAQSVIYRTKFFKDFGFYHESIGYWMDILPQWVLGLEHGFIYIPQVLALSQIDNKNWNIKIIKNRKNVYKFGRAVIDILPNSRSFIHAINESNLLSRVIGANIYILSNRKYWKYFKLRNIIKGLARELYFNIKL